MINLLPLLKDILGAFAADPDSRLLFDQTYTGYIRLPKVAVEK